MRKAPRGKPKCEEKKRFEAFWQARPVGCWQTRAEAWTWFANGVRAGQAISDAAIAKREQERAGGGDGKEEA